MTKTVTLFLMTEKGLISLEAIVNGGFKATIDFIIVGRDSSVVNDYAKEIITLAESEQIPWVERKEKPAIVSNFVIAISWRWLITLKNSLTRLIVLHDSLLPKYRGFAPLVNQLINQEPIIGVTALFASNEYDRGDIIFQEKTTINYPLKIKSAIAIISNLYGLLLIKLIKSINASKALPSVVQKETDASYSLWRNKEDYRIDWTKDSSYIERFINAVGFPYSGAQCIMNETTLIITDVEIVEDVEIMNRDCGKVLFMSQGLPTVVCGKGLLKLKRAFCAKTNKEIFPLNKFRIRFK